MAGRNFLHGNAEHCVGRTPADDACAKSDRVDDDQGAIPMAPDATPAHPADSNAMPPNILPARSHRLSFANVMTPSRL